MTNVNIAIGIGRAIVQNKPWPSGTNFANPLIEFFLLPQPHPLRLTLRQIAPHREGGIRKIQGVFVISHCACSQLEEVPGRHGICRDLGLEGIKIGETLLVA